MAIVKKPRNQKSKIESSIKKPKDNWLKELLDGATEDGQALWIEPVKYHRASGVGDPCIRSLAFSMLGFNDVKEARVLRIFRTGNIIEQTNIENMKKAGIFKSEQGEIQYEYYSAEADAPEHLIGLPFIIGHYDVIVEHDDEEYIVEIKSINETAFGKLPREHDFILAGESPLMNQHPKYVHQWNTYSGAEGIPKKGLLLFEAKNTQRQKMYFLEHDPALLAENLYKLEEAWNYGINEEIPPVPEGFNPKNPKDKNCMWCPKRYLCAELSEGIVSLADIRKTDAKLRD